MATRMIIMLVAVGLVLGSVLGFRAYLPTLIRQSIASQGVARQTVSTTKAEYSDWQPHLSAIGSLRAVNGADLSSELAGIVEKINFKSGDEVPAGALLLTLRAEDDIAKLQSLQAQADLAKITYDRDSKQLQAKAISQATLDSDTANLKNARALVDEQQATVDKKFVHAPFAGKLGIRQVDLGQYLAAGTTIVTLQQIDPIFMDFTLPQQALDTLKIGAPVTITVDAFPDRTFPGEIAAISPKVDAATRNLQVRASLPNPDHKLLPGMFGTVQIQSGTPQHLLTLPQTAIVFNSYGDSVYIVDEKGTAGDGKPDLVARQSFVTTTLTRGDQIAVTSGVKDGDTIVTAGQIKIHNGSPLAVNNTVQPKNDPSPHPTEQ